MALRNYFSDKELSCGCGCGFNVIHGPVLEAANDYREFKRRPVYGTSACRCIDHNKSVGGHPQSYHLGRMSDQPVKAYNEKAIAIPAQLAGYAIDLACPVEEQDEAVAFFKSLSIELQVFAYPQKGFIHINARPES